MTDGRCGATKAGYVCMKDADHLPPHGGGSKTWVDDPPPEPIIGVLPGGEPVFLDAQPVPPVSSGAPNPDRWAAALAETDGDQP